MFFNEINNERKQYWLGFLYQDGHISKASKKRKNYKTRLVLQESDREHLYKFKKDLSFTGNIKRFKGSGYQKENIFYEIVINDKQFYQNLSKFFSNNKTYVLHPPILEETLKKHFIRGLIEGDGSIIKRKRSYGFDWSVYLCGNLEMIQYFKENTNIKINNKIYTKKQYQEIDVSGNRKIYPLMKWLYKDQTVYLDRKMERQKEYFNYMAPSFGNK